MNGMSALARAGARRHRQGREPLPGRRWSASCGSSPPSCCSWARPTSSSRTSPPRPTRQNQFVSYLGVTYFPIRGVMLGAGVRALPGEPVRRGNGPQRLRPGDQHLPVRALRGRAARPLHDGRAAGTTGRDADDGAAALLPVRDVMSKTLASPFRSRSRASRSGAAPTCRRCRRTRRTRTTSRRSSTSTASAVTGLGDMLHTTIVNGYPNSPSTCYLQRYEDEGDCIEPDQHDVQARRRLLRNARRRPRWTASSPSMINMPNDSSSTDAAAAGRSAERLREGRHQPLVDHQPSTVINMSKALLVGLFALAFAGLTLGCSPEVPANPTYTNDVKAILDAHCVRCHGANDTLVSMPVVRQRPASDELLPAALRRRRLQRLSNRCARRALATATCCPGDEPDYVNSRSR